MPESSQEILRNLGKSRNQILVAVVANIGSIATGQIFGWSTVASNTIIRDFRDVTSEVISWITSLFILGALLGGPAAGFAMDHLGRKSAMLLFSIPFLLGWIILCAPRLTKPDGLFLFYIGRIITGICGGAYLVIIPTYIRETSTDLMRGVLGSVVPLMLVTGILYAFIIGAFCDWFVTTCCCCIPPTVFAICALFIPETPRYLLTKNKTEKAVSSFRWLCRLESNEVANEKLMQFYPAGSLQKSSHRLQAGGLFTRPVGFPIIIMVIVMFFQQFGGVNAVTLYTNAIFQAAGNFLEPSIATIIVGIVQVVFVVVAMFLLEVLGRKVLLIWGSFIMGLSLIGLGIYFHLKEKGDRSDSKIAWLPITCVCVYMAAYCAGVGTIPWVLATEIFNPHFRAQSATIMNTSYWVFGFLVANIYNNLNASLNASGSFWLFGGFCMANCIFTAFFVPETKGKSSAEIMNFFGVDTVNLSSTDSTDALVDVNADIVADNIPSDTTTVDTKRLTEKAESIKNAENETDNL